MRTIDEIKTDINYVEQDIAELCKRHYSITNALEDLEELKSELRNTKELIEVENKVLTNFDRIKNMSIEDMAKFLRNTEKVAIAISQNNSQSFCNNMDMFAIPKIINWLS